MDGWMDGELTGWPAACVHLCWVRVWIVEVCLVLLAGHEFRLFFFEGIC